VQDLGLDTAFFDPPQVICHQESNTKKSINLITVFARSMNADAIIVSSHGRTGVDRLLMGSFAEQLILKAQPPVIVLGKSYRNWEQERVLFATDLSAASKKALDHARPLLSALKAQVVLYHSLRRPEFLSLDPGILLPGGNLLPIQEFMKNEKVTSEALLQKWCDELDRERIRATRVVGEAHGDLALEIREAAGIKNATWIALASEHGALSASVFGSVARTLARDFDGPVWISHEEE